MSLSIRFVFCKCWRCCAASCSSGVFLRVSYIRWACSSSTLRSICGVVVDICWYSGGVAGSASSQVFLLCWDGIYRRYP